MSATTNATEAKWKKLRDGIAAVLPPGSAVMLNGQSVTQAQLLAKVDAVLSTYAASETAKAAASAAVATVHADAAGNRQWLADLTATLKQTLGRNSPLLVPLGLGMTTAAPPKTAESKALAAVKAAATRKARNVMSKKQRAAIPAVQGLSLQVVGGQGTSASTPAAAVVATPAAATPVTPLTPK